MVRDPRRRLVIADTVGRRIVVLDDTFHLAGSWGGFGDEDGRFRKPAGLALDPAGASVYVLDAGRRRVQAFDLDGRLRRAWGGPGDGPGEFVAPSGISTGKDGSVYVVDRGANRVQRFDGRGAWRAAWGSAGAGPGQFKRPEAVHVDGRGRVIVIDSGNRRAQAFTAGGRFLWEMSLDPAEIAAARAHPPRPVRRAASRREDSGGRYTLCATTFPDPVPLNEPFAMNVLIYESPGRSRLAQKVILDVDATMPEHHHGMSLKPKVRAIDGPAVQDLLPGHGALGDGRFEVRGMLFHMPGRWEIHFDITHGAITERAQIEIELD
jgi:DNA-binding beta-propeller fold protein YncE